MNDRGRAHLTLAVLAAAATIYGAQGISPALPAVQERLGIGDSGLGLFTAAYMLPGVVLAVPLGYLADWIGRRKMFVSMALLYGVAGAAQALVTRFDVLLVLRVLQGVGFASLMPLSMTLIADAYEGAAHLRAQAWRQISMAAGEFVLPLVGAALAGWSWNAPLAAQGVLIPVAVAGWFRLGERRPESAAAAGYASELVEAVRLPGMPAVLAAGFLRFWCKFALVSYLPFVLVHERGASLGEAALVLSLAAAVNASINLGVVRALHRTAPSRLLMAAIVLVGGALVGFAVVPTWQLALVVGVAFGVGDGTLMVLQNAFVSIAAPERVRAGLVGVSSMTRNGGKLVAPLAVGGLMLAVSPPAAFALVGLSAWALVPLLRPLRKLDRLLRSETTEISPAVEPV